MPIELAPYDKDGNLLHYVAPWQDQDGDVDWCRNDPFETTIRIQGVHRGRSSAYFIWVGESGETYPMFLTDMVRVLQAATLRKGGKVSGRWSVVKRGENFGLSVAPDE